MVTQAIVAILEESRAESRRQMQAAGVHNRRERGASGGHPRANLAMMRFGDVPLVILTEKNA
jgi:hypothetical protein